MNVNQKYENSIFWIDTLKISPNPYQPRREFDQGRLEDLAESIKQYGILQPLTVSRIEVSKHDGGIAVEYELIAGERRLRASKLAGLNQVPCIIRVGDDSKAKLELAIIENLQREDLNPVERAKSFQRLSEEFSLKHQDIGKKVSKSREYVSNTMRLLTLPQDILDALEQGRISEGHTRPLLMLQDRQDEQVTLFKEMLMRKMTVREAEGIARRIAYDKVRKKDRFFDPDIADMEGRLAESLGTRVHIERKEVGGKILIDFFSYDELQNILKLLEKEKFEKSSFLTQVQETNLVDIPEVKEEILTTNKKHFIDLADGEILTRDTGIENITNIVSAQNIVSQESTLEETIQVDLQNNNLPHVLEENLPEAYTEHLPAVYTNHLPSTELNILGAFAPEDKHAFILDDRSKAEVRNDEEEDDLYNIKKFSI